MKVLARKWMHDIQFYNYTVILLIIMENSSIINVLLEEDKEINLFHGYYILQAGFITLIMVLAILGNLMVSFHVNQCST